MRVASIRQENSRPAAPKRVKSITFPRFEFEQVRSKHPDTVVPDQPEEPVTVLSGSGTAGPGETLEIELDPITSGGVAREDASGALYVIRAHFEGVESTVDETVVGNSAGLLGLTWDDIVPSDNAPSNAEYLRFMGLRAIGDGVLNNKGRLYVDGGDRTFISGRSGNNTSFGYSIAELSSGSPVNITGADSFFTIPKNAAAAPTYAFAIYATRDGDDTNCGIARLADDTDLSSEAFNMADVTLDGGFGDLNLEAGTELTWVSYHFSPYQSGFRYNGVSEVDYRYPTKFVIRNPLSVGNLVLDYVALKYSDD